MVASLIVIVNTASKTGRDGRTYAGESRRSKPVPTQSAERSQLDQRPPRPQCPETCSQGRRSGTSLKISPAPYNSYTA